MRSYCPFVLFMILASTTARVEAQTAVASTLNATLVGREVAGEVIRDHADEIRSIALLEACDHKDLAAPLRDSLSLTGVGWWNNTLNQNASHRNHSTSCQ